MAKKKPTPGTTKPPPAEQVTEENAELADLVEVLDYIVSRFIKKTEESAGGLSLSVSDLVRTVQLRRELMPEELIKEIEVRWVESSETAL